MVTRLLMIAGYMVACFCAAISSGTAQSTQVETVNTEDNIARIISRNQTAQIVAHSAGQSEVSLEPLRIVSLHNVYSEALVALDIVPAGMVGRAEGAIIQLKAALKNVPSVGDQSNPDYEAILALKPDLILSVGDMRGQNYELLSAIAPTVVLHEPDGDWRAWFKALAKVLNREEKAQDVITAYDQKAAAVRQELQKSYPDETVLLLRVRQKDIRIYGAGRRAGPVLYKDLQLAPHRLVPVDHNYQPISNELIAQMDADRIFLMIEDQEKLGNIEKTALWQALPAVKAQHIYKVNIQSWNQSSGPISATTVVDDIAAAFGVAK